MNRQVAKLIQKPEISLTVVLALTEDEARALDAMFGYNPDSFFKVFYEHLGSHYLQPYEQAARSLMESLHKMLPQEFARVDRARKEFAKPACAQDAPSGSPAPSAE